MRFTTLFFDLDDTLYPSSTGLWLAIKDRMNLYMIERLGLPESDVPFLREQYFKMYGTTLRGLEERHKVDKQDFLAYVHDLPLTEYLCPNPVIRDVIASLPTRNFIFTNADASHARRVSISCASLLVPYGLFGRMVSVSVSARLEDSYTVALLVTTTRGRMPAARSAPNR